MEPLRPHVAIAQPGWLLLLAVLPLLFYYARRSLTGLSERRQKLSLILRCTVLVGIVVGLSDIRLVLPTSDRCLIFAVDRSWSVSAASREAADAFLEEASLTAGDSPVIVMPFAGEPLPAGSETDAAKCSQETDLESAVETASGLAPAGYVPHVVLLSDGNETKGDGLRSAKAAALPISTVRLEPRRGAELYESKERPDQPRILMVEGEPGIGRHLAEALGRERIDVDRCGAEEMPRSSAALNTYPLVVLANVPVTAITQDRVSLLQNYVRNSAGGLVVVGGERSLTPGGYRGTLLEEILPVRCEASEQDDRPSLAMVLVVDRSYSMKQAGAIELAKEAMRRAVNMLQARDQFGLLVFDEGTKWVRPIAPLADKAEVLKRIETIVAEGRTDMYPAIEKAYLALDETFAQRKHMLVLTDGISHPGDFESLASAAARSGVTVSTVALGREACGPLLQRIAQVGQGRYYACDQPQSIPAIFALETAGALRLGIREKPSYARPTRATPFLDGIDVRSAPPLLGHIETQPKPEAQTELTTETGAPLLAWHQYGRGTAAVFASDAQDRWAATWVRWPDFGRFWSRVVRHAMRQPRELQPLPADEQLLRSIAETTGGRYNPTPSEVFPTTDRTALHTWLLWPYLLAASAVLFVLDLTIRRTL